jgi:hypothetical protein
MRYLNEPLDAPVLPPPPIFAPTAEVLAALTAAGAFSARGNPRASSSLDTPETSFSADAPTAYAQLIRSRDWPEWYAALAALESLRPLVTDKRIWRFRHCLQKAWFFRHNETGSVHVFSSACKDRACPVCGQRRSYDLSRKVASWVQSRTNVRFYTFTLRANDAPLDSQISALYRAFGKFRKFPDCRRAMAAGIWFFQTTYTVQSGQWHPHLHVLAVGSFLSQDRLCDLWRLASGDSYIVDVRFVHNPATVASYVARYAARPYKLTDLPEDRRSEAVLAFWSRRLFGTWGKLEARPKIKQEKPSLAEYTCLGSYNYVQQLRGYDWRADAIWAAYANKTPLMPQCQTYDWDKAVDWMGHDTIVIDPPPG